MDTILDFFVNILSKNLWVGLLAIVLYGIWKSSPIVVQIISEHLKSKNDELNKITTALESNSQALEKISEAIHSFERAMLGSEARIREEIHTIKHDIKEEIRDNRLQELKESIPISTTTLTGIGKKQKTVPPK